VATTDQHSHSTGAKAPGATADEPSADWGWHGSFPRATALAGWITAIALFAMMIGNHTTYVENVWLIALGTLLVIMLLGGSINRMRAKRR